MRDTDNVSGDYYPLVDGSDERTGWVSWTVNFLSAFAEELAKNNPYDDLSTDSDDEEALVVTAATSAVSATVPTSAVSAADPAATVPTSAVSAADPAATVPIDSAATSASATNVPIDSASAAANSNEAVAQPAPAPAPAVSAAPTANCSVVTQQPPGASDADYRARGERSIVNDQPDQLGLLEEGLLGGQSTEENAFAVTVPTSTSAPTSDSAADSAAAADNIVVTQQPVASDADCRAMEEGWDLRSFSLGSLWWLYRPNEDGAAPDTFPTQFIGLGLALNCVTFLFLPLIVNIGLKMTDHDHDSRSVDSSYGTLFGYGFVINLSFFAICCLCMPCGLCGDMPATRRRVSQCENHAPYPFCTGVCLHNSEIFLRLCQGRERENRSNGDGQIAAM